MYQYDIPDSNENGYHKKYLKLVGATIFFTVIGILIFIQLRKDIDKVSGDSIQNDRYEKPAATQTIDQMQLMGRKIKSFKARVPRESNQRRYHQKRHWEPAEYAMATKENDFRQHLKAIQRLISELKYYPY